MGGKWAARAKNRVSSPVGDWSACRRSADGDQQNSPLPLCGVHHGSRIGGFFRSQIPCGTSGKRWPLPKLPHLPCFLFSSRNSQNQTFLISWIDARSSTGFSALIWRLGYAPVLSLPSSCRPNCEKKKVPQKAAPSGGLDGDGRMYNGSGKDTGSHCPEHWLCPTGMVALKRRTPGSGRAEYSHLQPFVFVFVLLQGLCRLAAPEFRSTSSLFSALSFEQIMDRPISFQPQFIFDLPVAHSCLHHLLDDWQQVYHIAIFFLAHEISPLMLLSYIRGDFVYCPFLLVLFIQIGGHCWV